MFGTAAPPAEPHPRTPNPIPHSTNTGPRTQVKREIPKIEVDSANPKASIQKALDAARESDDIAKYLGTSDSKRNAGISGDIELVSYEGTKVYPHPCAHRVYPGRHARREAFSVLRFGSRVLAEIRVDDQRGVTDTPPPGRAPSYGELLAQSPAGLWGRDKVHAVVAAIPGCDLDRNRGSTAAHGIRRDVQGIRVTRKGALPPTIAPFIAPPFPSRTLASETCKVFESAFSTNAPLLLERCGTGERHQ